MYPKAHLDSLSDGILGVAMTLLVLNVRLRTITDRKTDETGARSVRPDTEVSALRDQFRRARFALAIKRSRPFQRGIL